jgi:DNA-directed RNA polymerase specialized sigma subunit
VNTQTRTNARIPIPGRASSPAHLVQLAAHLPNDERGIIDAIYRDGIPTRTVAEIRGVTPWELRRQLSRLIRRLESPEFILTIRRAGKLSSRDGRIARACFVEGLPTRTAAQRLGVSYYQVRRQRERILSMLDALKLAELRKSA